MPLDPVLGAAIGTAGNIAGSLISNAGNKASQKRANEYNLAMYNRQRADSVADRDLSRKWALEDWNMENEYNSPTSQMMRYKDAGLNPNLIYGEGVSASSGQASEPRSTETRASQQGNSQAARYNMDFGMAQFTQNMLMSAQADKLKAETDAIRATTEKTGAETETLRTMLPINKETGEINIQQARANIDKIGTEILGMTKDLDVKTQQIIESDSRIKKMFNDMTLSWIELQNAINQTDINRMDAGTRKGELAVHQRDVFVRENQLEVNRAQQKFNEKMGNFDAEMRQTSSDRDWQKINWDQIYRSKMMPHDIIRGYIPFTSSFNSR